jgi:hypothetical protein
MGGGEGGGECGGRERMKVADGVQKFEDFQIATPMIPLNIATLLPFLE